MTGEMVHIVARAISGAPFPSQASIRKARDAILAMRAPTEAMLVAAYSVSVAGADLHDFEAYDCGGQIWQAMIDAALSPEQEQDNG